MDRDASPRRPVGVARQLLLCCDARRSWPQQLMRPGRSRAGVDLARGHLGRRSSAPPDGRAGTTASVAAFCERRPFFRHRCNKMIQQMRSDKAGRSQTAATALRVNVAAPVRARKNKIQTWKLCLHDQPWRAVDCAPYLLSAPQRLSR